MPAPFAATLALISLASGAQAAADGPAVDPELEVLVKRYFQGMVDGDGAAIRDVFHPDAQLFGVFGGQPVTIPLEAWIERIEGDPQPAPDARISPAPEDGVEWRILSAEVEGDIARLAVRDRFLGVWYTDYLTLRRSDGAWRIVNKTFTYDKR